MGERWTLRWQFTLETFSPQRSAEVELPEGWYRVLSGVVKPGDLFLDFRKIKQGLQVWRPVEKSGDPHWCYACLIRKGTAVDKRCERCGEKVAVPGERYCEDCREAVLKQIRKQRR